MPQNHAALSKCFSVVGGSRARFVRTLIFDLEASHVDRGVGHTVGEAPFVVVPS